MANTMALGALRVVHARLHHTWHGRWLVDVDVDLDKSRAVPSGKQTLTLGQTTLSCTVDPDRVGRFGEKASLRLLGGAGGWQKTVPEKAFHNDAGVMSSAVLATTAIEVGETVVDLVPVQLGVDYVRAAGPASNVLTGRDWYVDLQGNTIIGARPTAPAPKTIEVLSWDGGQQKAEIACDEVLVPGTSITDDRFGTIIVRDVEQEFADGHARATAWCGPAPVSRLIGALAAAVRQQSGALFLAKYRYRIVAQGVDGRLTLQAVEKVRGLPDLLPISVWPGMAGLNATFPVGTECLVEFIAGDPARPIVSGFEAASTASALVRASIFSTWAQEVEASLTALGAPVTTSITLMQYATSVIKGV